MSNVQGLIADIGATNARFALIKNNQIHDEIILKCDSYASIDEAIYAYFDQINVHEIPKIFSMAIACPVTDDIVSMTNHSWEFSKLALKEKFKFNQLNVMNDFEAVAFSIINMDPKFMIQIGTGKPKPSSNKVVLGPGSGLGAASLVALNENNHFKIIGGEGGHVTAPARTQREFDIFHYLETHKYSHTSAERVCCGKGLLNLYDTIRVLDNKMDLPALLPEEITEKAIKNESDVCKECLDLMIRILARIAGNMVLSINAYGGVYIAGGIAPKLVDYIQQSNFRDEFISKGRYKDYMKSIPTYVITHPYPAFEGLKQDILKNL